jgi:glycosyltransferase involved in cell wall biosynthesis
MKPKKIAYIHGRPWAHPMHRKFAESVNAQFHFVDFKMRWQDKNRFILYRIISWLVCAFTFPSKKTYQIFLVDNLHFMPVIMKLLGLITKKQKIVAHLGSHTLYFIYTHRFSTFTEHLHIKALKHYDALICEGKMAETLVRKILGDKTPKIYTVINGIPSNHFPVNSIPQPLNGKNILFIGQGPGQNRSWYKGLDLMIDAFSISLKEDPELTFTIVGEWDDKLKVQLLEPCTIETRNAICFVGQTDNLGIYISKCTLYLHCARGEAYGLTILIAMSHGVPPLISEWTGAKEVVEQVSKELITPLDAKVIAKKIIWYFRLSESERFNLSQKSLKIGQSYTEEKAIHCFKEQFIQLEKDFQII